MDTSKDMKIRTLEDFYARAVWFLEFETGARVSGLTIKCEPTGYLAIIKAITAEGPKVAFLGARTLDKIRTVLSSPEGREKLKWRVDQYTLDRIGKV